MAYLSLKDINKIYPNGFHAVHDFNLEIEKGEFIVFVGPSGCGKSTTLRMIAGLEDISKGDFLIDGVRANEKGPRDRGIAMVFQSYALYPQMTVYDNLAFGLTLQGIDEDIIEKIDIGGISLIRAGAKNFKDVVIVPSKAEYGVLLDILNKKGANTDIADRKMFAERAFGVSSHYDTAIHDWFAK